MLCYDLLCYVMFVMLCYVMLCYVMLCYVMLCCVMLCLRVGISLVEVYKRGGKGTKQPNRHILRLGNGVENVLV